MLRDVAQALDLDVAELAREWRGILSEWALEPPAFLNGEDE
jgi:hypothetical protein